MIGLLVAAALTLTDPDAVCRAQCECMHAPDDGTARTCTLLGGCNCAELLGTVRTAPPPLGTTLPYVSHESDGPCDLLALLRAVRDRRDAERQEWKWYAVARSTGETLRLEAADADALDSANARINAALVACEDLP